MTDQEDTTDEDTDGVRRGEAAESLDARGRIEEALDGVLDRETLDVLLKEGLAVTKQARGWCPNCKKAVQVDIPDSKAVVSAMGELLTQAKGRPEQEVLDDQHVTVFYSVITTCSHGDDDEVIQNGKKLNPEEAARYIAEHAIETKGSANRIGA